MRKNNIIFIYLLCFLIANITNAFAKSQRLNLTLSAKYNSDSTSKDQDFDICKNFIISILEKEIDYADILFNDTNYKDQLLRFYHQNKWGHPIYEQITFEGPPHKRIFTMGVKDKSNLPTNAIKYISFIEEFIGIPVTMLSTSPEREDTILFQNPFKTN